MYAAIADGLQVYNAFPPAIEQAIATNGTPRAIQQSARATSRIP
jgi:hypothetical protein